MPLPRVIIADDHVLVGEGIRRLLQSDFDVVDCVRDGAALVESAERLHPDVVITDVSMPGLDGIDAIRQLREKGNPASAIVLTMHANSGLAAAALAAGASGYVLKDAASDELIHAIKEALAGQRHSPGASFSHPKSTTRQRYTRRFCQTHAKKSCAKKLRRGNARC
jgi:DNA-binding NarL/FixJ family response regulator